MTRRQGRIGARSCGPLRADRSTRVLRGLLVAGALLAGCAPPIQVTRLQEDASSGVTRIGLMPVEEDRARSGAREPIAPDGAAILESRLIEALTLWSGVEFVPPDAIANWLDAETRAPVPQCAADDARCRGVALARAFDVNALLHVVLRRFRPREGSAASARQPAAVWFELELRSPSGVPMWRGIYDEEQPSLTSDLGSLPRAIDRGLRWVTAERLASDGAKMLVQELDAELRRWR